MTRDSIVNTINSLKGEEGHRKIVEVYNSQNPLPQGYKLKMSDAWCAATVSAVFLMNGGCSFSECSCSRMIDKGKKLGIWVENDAYIPKKADVCFFDWQDNGSGDNCGIADHVGIIIEVNTNNNSFIVREGNKNHSIGVRTMKIDGRYIRGFITPKFDEISNDTSNTTNTTPSSSNSQNGANSGYVVGRTYTIHVNSALNVRKGAGTNYPLVGYNNLSADAKKHATSTGALRNGTRVTCKEIKTVGNSVWMRIPSGWICAISGNNVYVK